MKFIIQKVHDTVVLITRLQNYNALAGINRVIKLVAKAIRASSLAGAELLCYLGCPLHIENPSLGVRDYSDIVVKALSKIDISPMRTIARSSGS